MLRGTNGMSWWLTLTLMMSLLSALGMMPAHASRSELLSRPIDDLLLDQHNTFRQEEKASNIFKMHWNKTAQEAAQRWSDRCEFKHQYAGPFGENLFYSSNPEGDETEIMLGGLEVWHDEKRGWRYSSAACGAACHYTQMVWYSTTSLGCAHKMCHGLKVGSRRVDRALYLVCFYYPRGNWVGEYPFKTGRPCSNCGSGTCQDGLCVEEKTSFSSYQSISDKEVKEGSSWQWSYDARGPDSHRRSSHNVSTASSTRRHGHNHVTHTLHHQSQRHDVSYNSGSRRHSHTSSQRSSSYQYTHSTSDRNRNLKPAELRHGRVTHSSGGRIALKEPGGYSGPTTARQRGPTPISLRQEPRQAQYARAGLERVANTINNFNGYNNGGIRNGRRRDSAAARRRRVKSPLEVLRAGNHWCRDRLPSCRIWTAKCAKSKAVYVACPRTCGHCGQKRNEGSKANALRDRPPPSQQPSPQPRRHHHRHRSSPFPSTTLSTYTTQRRRLAQQRQRQRQRPHPLSNRLGGSRDQQRNASHQRQQQRHGQRLRRPGEKKRGRGERRKKGGRRRQVHKRFKTVDSRAENLAEELRLTAVNGGQCSDDPKYARSCPFWVKKGFCTNNELLSNVYCKRTCGSC